MSKSETSDDAITHFKKGLQCAALGGFIRAIPYYEKAIELDPNNHEFYSKIGNAYFVCGYIQKAIECYEKAIELNTNSFSIYRDKINELQQMLEETKTEIDNSETDVLGQDIESFNNHDE